jgi:predicted dithiol-disulfide oxidoreductase (DUF899 family)
MSLPQIATREEWLAARTALLEDEKALTRARDALNTKRRELPMVRIDTDYTFDGPDGTVHLLDLFDGRSQLIVYHFMFDPSWDTGCSSCTAGTDELSPGFFEHLHARDTSYAMVSLAPYAKLAKYRAERGWDVPWYSSWGTTFNDDFAVTVHPDDPAGTYNFRTNAESVARGDAEAGATGAMELPGRSCFLQVDGEIFHTYSQYARGLEMTGGSYYFLDLTALGRQEDWEEPKGRGTSVHGPRPDFSA